MRIALEAKATARLTSDHLKALRELKKDHRACEEWSSSALEPRARVTEDGIEIFPVKTFLEQLAERELF